MEKHAKYQRLIEYCQTLPALPTAVAHPCDQSSLKGAVAPLGELVDIMDVGYTCAFLATPYARRLSGSTLYIDGGLNIVA
jgi:enoyl-[acyl-carrier-protein] reductase (NADH)